MLEYTEYIKIFIGRYQGIVSCAGLSRYEKSAARFALLYYLERCAGYIGDFHDSQNRSYVITIN